MVDYHNEYSFDMYLTFQTSFGTWLENTFSLYYKVKRKN